MRKAVFFSLDALIAAILIITVVVLTPLFYLKEEENPQNIFYSSDVIQLLSSIRIDELNNSGIALFRQRENLTDVNKTILEQILRFQVEGDEDKASELLNLILSGLVPDYYGMGVWIEGFGEPVLSSNLSYSGQLISSKQMVSGIERGRAIEGLAARALLTDINERFANEYIFFGGYEGDGNLTKEFSLPSTLSSVDSAYMEIDAGSSFNLYFNGNYSGAYVPPGSMAAGKWDINSSYLQYFQPGANSIVVGFNGTRKYIGGGYIRLGHTSAELSVDNSQDRYTFPGVDGIINIYSSLFVPGALDSMGVYLHYDSNYEIFLALGGETVYSYNSNGENSVNITDSELRLMLNYTGIGKRTLPLRLGLRNVSLAFGGRSDSVLITDRTGSMEACDVDTNCTFGICDTYAPCHDRRDRVAQNSDRTFLNEILSVEGNSVGMIGYGKELNPVCSFTDIIADNATLQDSVDDYYNEWCGYTCISCGIAAATQILTDNKLLYGTTVKQAQDTSQVHLGDTGSVSTTKSLEIEVNHSNFIKAALTIFGKGVDITFGYKDCVFFNDHYLGRMCIPSDDGSSGWHTCSYPINQEWLPTSNASIGQWVTTSKEDFEACSLTRIDLDNAPGDAVMNTSQLAGQQGLFSDNFDDGNSNGWSESGGNWAVRDQNGYTWQVGENGIYRQRQTAYNSRSIAGNQSWQDYIVEAKVRINDADPMGIYFRYNSTHFYRFEFADGYPYYGFRLYRYTPSGYTLLGYDYSFNPGRGVWYKMKAKVEGTSIKCYFDRGSGYELIFDTSDSSGITAGKIGIYSSYSVNADFDNINVSSLSLSESYVLSQVLDAGRIAGWEGLSWTQALLNNTNLSIDIRSGNTAVPDSSWDNFYFQEEPYSQETPHNTTVQVKSDISQSSSRYIQWRAKLTSSQQNLTPALQDVSVNYSVDTKTNFVTITGGTSSGCFETSGDNDDWDLKDVTLKVWESPSNTSKQSYASPSQVNLDDGAESATTVFDTGVAKEEIKSAYLAMEAYGVAPSYYDCVYVNGHYIGRLDYPETSGSSVWENITLEIPTLAFDSAFSVRITSGNTYGCDQKSGDNDAWSYRNLNLTLRWNNETSGYNRFMSMLVMSDGEANTKIGHTSAYNATGAGIEAVEKACEAFEDYGIRIYSVTFGSGGDEELMEDIACCDDCSHHYSANNAEELLEIYKEIAQEIVKLQYEAQIVNVTGNISTVLFPDSYIDYTYTKDSGPQVYNRIPITLETARMDNNITEGSFYIPQNTIVSDAKITSYSSDRWTDKALINQAGSWTAFYNLSEFGYTYHPLGDPYIINIPVELISQGTNQVRISTGINPYNSTGGSPDDRVIYTVEADLDVNYTGIFETAQGCIWTLAFEDDSEVQMPIPDSYEGSNSCVFDNSTDCSEFSDDAINNALCYLFRQLDFDDNGKLFVKFGPHDLATETYSVGKKIPYMWGPTMVEVRIWK
ncbi:MAG TPA: hypothetical protein VFF28_00555 [Candidatus Nanoarchaeia archaeon]|nr:hypothetical protein [Candidatus Nanoarchaeia archaeon]